jgi:hypothetical protein
MLLCDDRMNQQECPRESGEENEREYSEAQASSNHLFQLIKPHWDKHVTSNDLSVL